ncbi:FtsX-like permease family protein [Streptomyces sp. NBC_00140]|uniref:FtsX-like permease family protein n=1 Tax=Streptomyces sp. NBC_00140 TaxID=2975664 RepID=UPI00225BCCB3|nr:FtsX-like permease family protein [Streptomyces sp. NBC_00140]MCX5334004.1 ABC transporter permease [Streptomyces sp. NBC_00140]
MRSRPVVAPWIRTRLRAAPGAALALALMVALTACLAAAIPRAVDRYEDAGLHGAVEQAGPDRTTVQLYAQPEYGIISEHDVLPATLADQYTKILDTVQRPVVADRGQSTYGVRTANSMEVPDPWIPQPTGTPAQVTLVAQHGLADHVRSVTGRLPRASDPVTASTPEVEGAVSAATAKSLHIEVGSRIHVPGEGRDPLVVRITGIVTPSDPAGAYWSTHPVLHRPSLVPLPGANAEKYWLGALLLAPEAAPALLGTPGTPWRYWQLAPVTSALHAYDAERLKSAVASLESGPALQKVREVTGPLTDADTDLDEILTAYDRLREGVTPLVAVAAVGAGTVAAVVLLMAGGLAADRRRTELALLRARGASLRGLAGRLFAETATVAVPAGALGLTAALLLLPEGRRTYALAAAAAVTAAACAALPLRAVVAHRVVRIHTGREDVATARPSRRRTVAELTLLVLALAAVETLRRRGSQGDELSYVAPVLTGVIAALALVRLYPLPLRRLARPAGRLRGVVAHLSLARAGRTSASAVLPLLALLTALTTAAFGGSVLTGVSEARDHAALLAIGADARVDANEPLPAALPDRVRRMPGVRDATAVSIAYDAQLANGRQSAPLVGVDPAGYAALAARTGLGPFEKGELTKAREVLTAVASPTVAATYGTRPIPVRLQDGTTFTVRITTVRDRTPAVSGTEFLVVNRAELPESAARPTALLLTGAQLNATALRKAAGGAGHVQLRSEERARYVDSPLQSGAEDIYTAAVAAGAGYAVLALLLSLLRAAPERTALLARLRTMGLTRAQGRRLLILESLPQAVLAAAGGALTGWATVALLSPGIDLTTIALASAPSSAGRAELSTSALSLAIPAASVVLVTVGVAGIQAWWSGRRGSVGELRAGDAR